MAVAVADTSELQASKGQEPVGLLGCARCEYYITN